MAEPPGASGEAVDTSQSVSPVVGQRPPRWLPPVWLVRSAFWGMLGVFPGYALVFAAGLSENARAFNADVWSDRLLVLVMLQVVLAIVALVAALWRAIGTPGSRRIWSNAAVVVTSLITAVLAPICYLVLVLAWAFIKGAASGGAWGRPLRIRGRLRHPELREGSEWSRGDAPDVTALDAATRRALEALWLHDAQKEHASVPAFSRISWVLAAVGAPAELMEGAHRAALEEVDHARRCFALAAGYGGRSHSVEPMPDLLEAGLSLDGPPLEIMARESLRDGCLLEDFNADVAARCAENCRDVAVRDVLARIAREERSHAEFSWALLVWALERGGATVASAVRAEAASLHKVARPTACSARTRPLVAAAAPEALLRHGRIPDAEWARLWAARLAATAARLEPLLARGGSLKSVAGLDVLRGQPAPEKGAASARAPA